MHLELLRLGERLNNEQKLNFILLVIQWTDFFYLGLTWLNKEIEFAIYLNIRSNWKSSKGGWLAFFMHLSTYSITILKLPIQFNWYWKKVLYFIIVLSILTINKQWFNWIFHVLQNNCTKSQDLYKEHHKNRESSTQWINE